MRRAHHAVIVMTLIALLSAACGSDDPTAAEIPPEGSSASPSASAGADGEAFPVTLDSCGRTVTFTERPERVLTVASVAAPLLAAAGAANSIVARSFETASFLGEYDDDLADVPLVSTTDELSREEIIDREPDLVITYEGSATAPEDLEAAGIDVLVNRSYCTETAQGDFAEIFADVEAFGRLLGTSEAADAAVEELRERVAAVEDAASDDGGERTAAALIFGRDTPTISAYGDRSTIDAQLGILGLDNVFGDVDKRNFEPSIEELIERDPDVIVLLTQGDQEPDDVREALLGRAELEGVTAVREERILVLPFGYTGPSPIAVEGLEILARDLAGLA